MKEKILSRVGPAVLEKGFARLTSDEIASIAGVSKRTLYRYFPEKDILLSAVMDEFREKVRRIFEEQIQSKEGDPITRFHNILLRLGQTLSRVSPEFFQDLERLRPDEFAKLLEFRAARIRGLASLLKEGQNAGLVRKNLDPELSVEMLLMSINGVMRPSFLSRWNYSFATAFEALFEQFLSGVLAAAPQTEKHRGRKPAAGRSAPKPRRSVPRA